MVTEHDKTAGVTELAYAHGGPLGEALLRSCPEDFFVDETLGFELTGEGEHVWLHIEKRGANTGWVAGRIARLSGVPERDVGFSGMKDRHAVTRQWFSVPAPRGREVDWVRIGEEEGLRLLSVSRHNRKLRRGTHRANRFVLRLREVGVSEAMLAARIACVVEQGVPNYFGEQRFGREGGNLPRARAFFAGEYRPRGRSEQGMLISAARSAVFNRVLDERVRALTWNTLIDGEMAMLDGTSSVFAVESPEDPVLRERLARFDIHPTGPLWGRGEPATRDRCQALEIQSAEADAPLCRGLEAAGLVQERRALRLLPLDLAYQYDTGAGLVELSFTLPAGCFATVVLRELFQTREPETRPE